jgi:predicted site-specific integrase-resolvase
MNKLSTDQVARKLGIDPGTLSRYIKAGKVDAPPATMAGGMRMRLWSDSEVERLRQLLPKIANGRKTRYKKQSALSNQQSVKTKKKTQARVPAPHKKK